MDTKDAKRLLATQAPGYVNPDKNKTVATRPLRSHDDSAFSTNRKEDTIIDAIDMRNAIMKQANWIERLREGKTDVQQALNELSPEVLVELMGLVFNASSDKVKLAAIQDWLDRAGYSKVTKIAGAFLTDPNMSKEQLVSMISGLGDKTKTIEITDDPTPKE